jgi:hypothetical protein
MHDHGDGSLHIYHLFLIRRGNLTVLNMYSYEHSLSTVFIPDCTMLDYTHQYEYSLPTVFIPGCTTPDNTRQYEYSISLCSYQVVPYWIHMYWKDKTSLKKSERAKKTSLIPIETLSLPLEACAAFSVYCAHTAMK